MNLIELDIKKFSNEVASASPAPGGGSIAALCGTLGSALCQMVANLTMGKKKYHDVETQMLDVKEKSGTLRKSLLKLIDEDTLSYNGVLEAFKLPKINDDEKKIRFHAIQDALKDAAKVPFSTLEAAASAMPLVEFVVNKGNPNCITDAGVAAELINSAVQGAAYNVFINLMDIKDEKFCIEMKQKVLDIQKDTQQRSKQIRTIVERSIQMES